MRVVIAPDKFKGTLTAREAAEAMAKAARKVRPEWSLTLRPMADGGEGTCEALLIGMGGRSWSASVSAPLGGRTRAEVALLNDGRLCVEMASASGLQLLDGTEPDPMRASSTGTGECIREALGRAPGAATLIVGVGGSASTDGGTGAATTLGWRFLDARGNPLEPGGGSLTELARIDGEEVDASLRRAHIVGACDVSNRLLGPAGAAAVFARQKGASDDQIAQLEDALGTLADRIVADLGMDVRDLAGGGAGGGMGAGLAAFFGAELGRGFDVVSEATGLPDAIADADLVVTGEGSLDEQTLRGKVPAGVARLARDRRTPCLAVAGRIGLDPARLKKAGFTGAMSLEELDEDQDPAGAASAVERATRGLLRQTFAGRGDEPRRLGRSRLRRGPRL